MRLVFGSFELDLEAARLLRDGQDVALEPRAFALLLYLAQHPGRLLTRDELLREVWQAQSLSNGVTSNAIAKLRVALGQRPEERAPIETVHGRGYRFHLQPPAGPAATPAPGSADTGAVLRGGPARA